MPTVFQHDTVSFPFLYTSEIQSQVSLHYTILKKLQSGL